MKGLQLDSEKLAKMQQDLEGQIPELWALRGEMITILDDLTDADWNNTNSRKFRRHYKRGEEKLNADVKALETSVIAHLGNAVLQYNQMVEEIEAHFKQSGWEQK